MRCPRCGKPAKTERGLRKHLTGTRPYGGHELSESEAAIVVRQVADGRTAPAPALLQALPIHRLERRQQPVAAQPIRPGHRDTLKYMMTPDFAGVVELFESYPEIGGAYFRPLENGVRVVDLHPESPKPRIGVGEDSLIQRGSTAAELQPTMAARIEYLRRVRERQVSPSRENQLEARLVREAQRDALRLPGFARDLRFIHSQWRVDAPDGGQQEFTDLLAVDVTTGELVVIELKAKPEHAAVAQVQGYARYFVAHAADLVPFFEQVARMMGGLYDCQELKALTLRATGRALVAWPTAAGLHVEDASLAPGAAANSATLDLGPQSPGDPAFRARMRLHQSWYRAVVLGLPYGTGPNADSATEYGNMLRREHAEAGANFLTPQIGAVARERMAAFEEGHRFRCLHNLLSSQPMCFNLFGPMVLDHDLATRLIGTLLASEVDRVLDVRIEYAPAAARRALGDGTSLDAFITYRRPDGQTVVLGIETKLSEPFSQRRYETRRYNEITAQAPLIWAGSSDLLADVRWNQLWRNHMLVEMIRQHGGFDHGRLAVVRHPDDPDTAAAVDGYRALLTDPTTSFADWPLDALTTAWSEVVRTTDEATWIRELVRRYVDLSLSDSTL